MDARLPKVNRFQERQDETVGRIFVVFSQFESVKMGEKQPWIKLFTSKIYLASELAQVRVDS
jgi:hypothetical protein